MSNTDSIKRYIKYSIQLHSPLGIKKGELVLHYDENGLTGKLNIMRDECDIYNITASGDTLEFCCDIKTIIGDISCDVRLTDKGGSLYGITQTNKGCMAVTGLRLSA